MKKILFISNGATRTGAPIVLLHLIKWIKANTQHQIYILLKDYGSLYEEFNSLDNCYLWSNERRPIRFYKRFFLGFLNLLTYSKKITLQQCKILSELKKSKIDLIYSNTIASNDLLKIIKTELGGVKVISHIHEMKSAINDYYLDLIEESFLCIPDYYIFASSACKSDFVNLTGINVNENSRVIYEFVDKKKILNPKRTKKQMIDNYHLQNKFIIGAAGLMNFRKGTDIFINLSNILLNKYPDLPIYFIWVGEKDEAFLSQFYLQIPNKNQGFGDNILFTGVQENPQDFYQIFDLFVLTSREDPFPLVCIENGMLGTPLICFKNAGGIPEIFEENGGICVEYENTVAMLNKIIEFYYNVALREKLSSEIRAKASLYDVTNIAPEILSLIDNILL